MSAHLNRISPFPSVVKSGPYMVWNGISLSPGKIFFQNGTRIRQASTDERRAGRRDAEISLGFLFPDDATGGRMSTETTSSRWNGFSSSKMKTQGATMITTHDILM